MSNCTTQITYISEDSVIGDTREIINDNFTKLDSIACAVSNSVSVVENGAGTIVRITGNNGIYTTPETGVVTVGRTYSPPWHIGLTGKDLYSELVNDRKSLQVVHSNLYLDFLNLVVSQTPPNPGSETYTFINTNNVNVAVQYSGALTLGDGRVLLVPGDLNKGSIYDPFTNTFEKLNITLPIGFSNSILLPDGRVCFIPGTQSRIHFWSPRTNILTTSTVDLSIPNVSQPYNGGVLMADGKIMLVPYNRGDGTAIYDPLTDTIVHTYSTNFTTVGGNGFYSGILSLDGTSVILTPHDSTQIVKVNTVEPYSSSFASSGTIDPPQRGAFSSSVLLADGRIFFVPYNSTQAAIYNPYTDAVTFVGGEVFTVNIGSYRTGILIPDGRVCMVPYNASKVAYFNPQDNTITFSETVGTNSFLKYTGATVLENGDVLVAPYLESKALFINTGNKQGFKRSIVTGIFFKETI